MEDKKNETGTRAVEKEEAEGEDKKAEEVEE